MLATCIRLNVVAPFNVAVTKWPLLSTNDFLKAFFSPFGPLAKLQIFGEPCNTIFAIQYIRML